MPRGFCTVCAGEYVLREDGTVRVHGPHPYAPGRWNCPGSRRPPLQVENGS